MSCALASRLPPIGAAMLVYSPNTGFTPASAAEARPSGTLTMALISAAGTSRRRTDPTVGFTRASLQLHAHGLHAVRYRDVDDPRRTVGLHHADRPVALQRGRTHRGRIGDARLRAQRLLEVLVPDAGPPHRLLIHRAVHDEPYRPPFHDRAQPVEPVRRGRDQPVQSDQDG